MSDPPTELLPSAQMQSVLPAMDEKERDAGEAKGKTTIPVMLTLFPLIGLGIAWAIYAGEPAKYDAKLCQVKAYDFQWAYLGAFFFARTVAFLNMFPTIFKSRVMRGDSGNLRANMYIYTQGGLPVVMDDGPNTGKYISCCC
jgi:hypothetical protein